MNKLPRGFRNCNPGNIRKSSTQWLGKIEGPDTAFETFNSMVNGVRAMARILLNYQKVLGFRTVRQMIDRWAPPVENDTHAYVDAVGKRLGVGPDDPIDLSDPAILEALVGAVIHHENGMDLPDSNDLYVGVRRALA